jgi:hypothetical protein
MSSCLPMCIASRTAWPRYTAWMVVADCCSSAARAAAAVFAAAASRARRACAVQRRDRHVRFSAAQNEPSTHREGMPRECEFWMMRPERWVVSCRPHRSPTCFATGPSAQAALRLSTAATTAVRLSILPPRARESWRQTNNRFWELRKKAIRETHCALTTAKNRAPQRRRGGTSDGDVTDLASSEVPSEGGLQPA